MHLLILCSLLLAGFIRSEGKNSRMGNVLTHIFSVEDDLLALKQMTQDRADIKVNKSTICDPISVGIKYGSHWMCHHFKNEQTPCHFLSFGIQRDFTFDTALHELKNCSGLALDPTVNHPVKMTPGVIFIKAGANSPVSNKKWELWSVPALRKWVGHPLYALKMDCEGCEYSLGPDIMKDDIHFFDHVLQFNIEIHLPKMFAQTPEDVHNLGRLFRLIYLSG